MTHQRSILHPQFRSAQPRTTSRRGLAALLFLATIAFGAPASAQELMGKGHFAIGAERLFGFYLDMQHTEFGNVESDNDTTAFTLFWSPTAGGALLSIPRIAVDYFLDEHLTLGGTFGIASLSSDGPDLFGIIFNPRVGYALRLSHEFTFWPRGGITIAHAGGDADLTVFGITLEGMFAYMPTDNWALTGGPIIDLGFTGSAGDDGDHSEILIGLMFGITGWFEI